MILYFAGIWTAVARGDEHAVARSRASDVEEMPLRLVYFISRRIRAATRFIGTRSRQKKMQKLDSSDFLAKALRDHGGSAPTSRLNYKLPNAPVGVIMMSDNRGISSGSWVGTAGGRRDGSNNGLLSVILSDVATMGRGVEELPACNGWVYAEVQGRKLRSDIKRLHGERKLHGEQPSQRDCDTVWSHQTWRLFSRSILYPYRNG